MRSLAPALLLALAAGGCARAPIPASRTAERPADGSSLYRQGDFVVYRYSGLFSEEPVELREEIVARAGDRLEIEVRARRGAEERRWVQVVTDTAENREANRLDALFEVVGGERVRLANEGNRDIFRLYEWTLIDREAPERDRREVACQQRIGGQLLDCSCHEAQLDWHGRTLRSVQSECPGFLWTHGPARIWDEASGEEAWRLEVLEQGRRD